LKSQSVQYVIGLDYGKKRIGVAVGQTFTATANPLAIVAVKNEQPDWLHLDALIREWQPQALIIGLPKYADGSDNAVTLEIRHFQQQLQERYQLPIHTIDETLSSIAAAQQLAFAKQHRHTVPKKRDYTLQTMHKSQSKVDAVAAQIILETWFAECL
jgi:putative Holliday junction resolvase